MKRRGRSIRRKASGVLAIALLWTVLPGAPAAQATVPAGYDLFETDPQSTHFDLQLPADFFAPGSDPFQAQVKFGGVPLETFMGHNTGDADTIVQRQQAAAPLPATVPIEIVALNLISVEPITVTFNGGQFPQLWDVRANLSTTQPSQGQITIDQTGPSGGTFDSQLLVVPLLTFVDLADGQTRVLDGAILPPEALTLSATGVPWRTGCILPALHVPGLNDGFCPSFTPDGQKQLTIEQALLAHHGVRPAQPAQEHFKCYLLKEAPFKQRKVQVTDVFGTRTATVIGRHELCNPVRKNNEPFLNKRAHLVCYGIDGVDPQKEVSVRNQFGSQRLLVREARRLCLPSQKRKLQQSFRLIKSPIDHRQCYRVEPRGPLLRQGAIGQVTLTDQFGVEEVDIGQPVQLCVPVQKNTSRVKHVVHAAVCYAIVDALKRVTVEIKNQFERRQITTKKPVMLCVPSARVDVPIP